MAECSDCYKRNRLPGKLDRAELTSRLAAHVLKHGLATASLRPMAAAAGTSDRMLIYHFGDKDRLIAEVLDFLAREMGRRLDSSLPADPFPTGEALVASVVGQMRSEALAPFAAIWFEILAASAREIGSYRAIGKAILDFFVDWLSVRHPDGRAGAALALTLIEGALVLDAGGQHDLLDQALRLPTSLSTKGS
jgi:AcrR family transcriptional regulator